MHVKSGKRNLPPTQFTSVHAATGCFLHPRAVIQASFFKSILTVPVASTSCLPYTRSPCSVHSRHVGDATVWSRSVTRLPADVPKCTVSSTGIPQIMPAPN
ncbi:hypothetical protein BG006_009372 [Podila minutissima]|uniref:Uncharacterized protein n=1 Tax=Podila minutissima TaxID=64525 RepID=A0A9P5SRQ2_9FUNG|nr:hypothetical protein BG006_009372 [Podila minutissima]